MRLTLLRHGLAEPAHDSDFARELLPQGFAQARFAAEAIGALTPPPDYVIASPAMRTLQTARSVIETLKLPPQRLQLEPRLYLAAADSLLEVLRAQEGIGTHLLLVGHNPGLSELARRLGQALNTSELATGEWRTFDVLLS